MVVLRDCVVGALFLACVFAFSHSYFAELEQYFTMVPVKSEESFSLLSSKLGKRSPKSAVPTLAETHDYVTQSLQYDRMFLITACTMVKGEAPYIVEWIEFMKLQGIERFIIYDDDSSDNVSLLNDLYGQKYRESDVFVIRRIVSGHQAACFQHCVSTYGKNSEWILIADVDEFVYSPTSDTLRDMILDLPKIEEKQNRSVDVIHINCTRFSTFRPDGSQQQHRFQSALERRPDGSVVYRNGCGLQQITTHTRRGPDPNRYPEEAALFKELNVPANGCGIRDNWNVCWHGPGKSLFRPQHVRVAGIHYPFKWDGPGLWSHQIQPPVKLAWCAHYYLRSVEDALDKARYWNKSDPARMIERSDAHFWNRVNDTALHDRWGDLVAGRMRALTQFEGECRHGGN